MPETLNSAENVAWESPGGVNLTILRRCDETDSVLNVSIDGGAVTIVAQNCQYAVTDPERERKGKRPTSIKKLCEFRLTVPLTRCQIMWKYSE
jgi:hypothetical protein